MTDFETTDEYMSIRNIWKKAPEGQMKAATVLPAVIMTGIPVLTVGTQEVPTGIVTGKKVTIWVRKDY